MKRWFAVFAAGAAPCAATAPEARGGAKHEERRRHGGDGDAARAGAGSRSAGHQTPQLFVELGCERRRRVLGEQAAREAARRLARVGPPRRGRRDERPDARASATPVAARRPRRRRRGARPRRRDHLGPQDQLFERRRCVRRRPCPRRPSCRRRRAPRGSSWSRRRSPPASRASWPRRHWCRTAWAAHSRRRRCPRRRAMKVSSGAPPEKSPVRRSMTLGMKQMKTGAPGNVAWIGTRPTAPRRCRRRASRPW